ncbi:MAG: DUF4157 domain-containing protein [Oscillospiraceae bacterium]
MYKYSAKNRQHENHTAEASQTVGITDNQALAAMSQYYDDSRKTAHQVDIGDALRARMSASFGEAAGDVKIYSNSGIADIGEKGFAKGNEVHLAPSVLSDSSSLESVLSHEMTHIAQQSAGRAYGSGLLMDDAQESEANSGMGMQIGTLASADYAPMQGNLATGLWKRMKNKVRTKLNRGGYADKKQQARAAVANTMSSGSPLADTFESELGQSRLLSYTEGLSEADRAERASHDDEYNAHYDEAASQHLAGMSDAYKDTLTSMSGDFERYNRNQTSMRDETADERIGRANERMKALSLMEAKLGSKPTDDAFNNDAHVKALRKKVTSARDEEVALLKTLPGYQEGLDAIKQRVEAVQSADSKDVGSHNKRLDDLKSAEMDLYKFQKKFDGAAYDTTFNAINIRISQLFKQLYSMTDRNGWDFHRAGTKDADADARANALWKSVRSGSGGLSIGSKRAEFGGRHHGNLTGLGDSVKGFRTATLGNIGRILSTDTGMDLVDALVNDNENSSTIRPVSYKNSTKKDVLNGPGAAGWDDVKKSRMNADSTNTANYISNNQGTVSANTGVQSLAMYNHNTADSEMNAVLGDGTTVISPQYVALAHEMMHSLHNNKGINLRHYKPGAKGFEGSARWSNLEELATMYGTDKVTSDTFDSTASDFSGYDDRTRDLMQKYVGNINEQKMRDELGIRGRYGHASPDSTKINSRKRKK